MLRLHFRLLKTSDEGVDEQQRGIRGHAGLLPHLRVVRDAVVVERAEHLNAQDSVEQEKEQQEDGDAPDLFPGSPAEEKKEEKGARLVFFTWTH